MLAFFYAAKTYSLFLPSPLEGEEGAQRKVRGPPQNFVHVIEAPSFAISGLPSLTPIYRGEGWGPRAKRVGG